MSDEHPVRSDDGLAIETAESTDIVASTAMQAKSGKRLILTTVSAAVLSLAMIGSLAYSGKVTSVLDQAEEPAFAANTVSESESEVEAEAALAAPTVNEAEEKAAPALRGFGPDSPERWQSALLEPTPQADASHPTEEAPPAEVAELDAAPALEAEAAEGAPVMRNVPIPMPRPPEFRNQSTQTRRAARQRQPVVVAAPAPVEDTRSFFEKLFGAPSSNPPALAYTSLETQPGLAPAPRMLAPMPAPSPAPLSAAPPRAVATTASLDTKPTLAPLPKPLAPAPAPILTPRAVGGTAIYDISAKTVTLPNGERLEAHSGIGETMDDPRYVHVSMRGATPPGTYDLTERESPFHGVRALRMNPIGGSAAVHGRVGLLTHSYLRGPSGASSGCVSFRDYNRFLQAYLRGEVARIVVVPGRGSFPDNPISSFVNKLFGGA